jgi:hypothetical protein
MKICVFKYFKKFKKKQKTEWPKNMFFTSLAATPVLAYVLLDKPLSLINSHKSSKFR